MEIFVAPISGSLICGDALEFKGFPDDMLETYCPVGTSASRADSVVKQEQNNNSQQHFPSCINVPRLGRACP